VGRGPGHVPGAIARPSEGTAAAALGARDPRQIGPEVDERTLDRRYDRYKLEIRQRVEGIREFPKALALRMPPRWRMRRTAVRDLAPARAEHARVLHRHRTAADQLRVQLRDQAFGIGFVDHEGEVEIVRRLRDQVHALASERRPDVGQAMQQRPHAATDQRDRRARRDHFHPAFRTNSFAITRTRHGPARTQQRLQ